MDELDAFLDERVGSDPDLLPDLLESLTKERDELEHQASRPLQNNTTRSLLATRSLARETLSLAAWRGGSGGRQRVAGGGV